MISPEEVLRIAQDAGGDEAFARQHLEFLRRFAQGVQARSPKASRLQAPILDASQWQIYRSDMPRAILVAKRLNESLQEALDTCGMRSEVQARMREVMAQYAQDGAYDSEPLYVLQGVLDTIYERAAQ